MDRARLLCLVLPLMHCEFFLERSELEFLSRDNRIIRDSFLTFPFSRSPDIKMRPVRLETIFGYLLGRVRLFPDDPFYERCPIREPDPFTSPVRGRARAVEQRRMTTRSESKVKRFRPRFFRHSEILDLCRARNLETELSSQLPQSVPPKGICRFDRGKRNDAGEIVVGNEFQGVQKQDGLDFGSAGRRHAEDRGWKSSVASFKNSEAFEVEALRAERMPSSGRATRNWSALALPSKGTSRVPITATLQSPP